MAKKITVAQVVAALKPKSRTTTAAPAATNTTVGANAPGLSVNRLVNNTLKEPDIKNAKYVQIKSFNLGENRKGAKVAKSTTVTNIPKEKSRVHKQTIYVRDDDSDEICGSKAVMVDCDCERFIFWWEYALAKAGAAKIKRGNGEPPVETNPGLKPRLCKHLFKVLLVILQKGL